MPNLAAAFAVSGVQLMTSRIAWLTASCLLASGLSVAFFPSTAFAQADNLGFVLGRVFEIDKKKYEEKEAKDDKDDGKEEDAETPKAKDKARNDETLYSSLPEYLEPLSDVEVMARLLENNEEFLSEPTGGDGDYVISKMSPGVLEFTLRHEDKDYPVEQRLGAQVNLAFVAELCFVVDKEEEVAWMVAAGPRRSADVPNWVPEVCQSPLGACLGMVTGNDDFREGLVLIFAGAGAAATAVGIAATRESAASPVEQ